MAVLVHRGNMHSEPPDWISWDGIHMIDEMASVTWIKMRVRVWGGLDGFSFFFSNSTFVLVTAAMLHPNPHACWKSQCNWWSLCVSMYRLALKLGNISPPEIEHSWQQLSGSQSAGKPTGFYVLSCTDLLADHPPAPSGLPFPCAHV